MISQGNFPQRVLYDEIFHYFEQRIPDAECTLIYRNPYTLLIAVVLSAQSTDKSVNKVMPFLMEHAPSPQDMLCLPDERLLENLKTIGLYQKKAIYLKTLSQQILDQYNGQVPSTRDELMSLSGVGRKSAHVILNILFQKPCIAVDTHVFRVARRLCLAKGNTPLVVEQELEAITPDALKTSLSFLLIAHGRTFCKARFPLCTQCPLRAYCGFFKNHKKDAMP